MVEGIQKAGYTPGEDIVIALDPAVSEIYKTAPTVEHEHRTLTSAELVAYWADLAGQYPIISIEDGMDEEDWDGWKALTDGLGERSNWSATTCSSPTSSGCREGSTGRGQLDPDQGQPDRHPDRDAAAVDLARSNGYTASCAPVRRDRGHYDRRPRGGDRVRPDQDRRAVAHDRVAKYNQLLRIEEALGADAEYPGRSVFRS